MAVITPQNTSDNVLCLHTKTEVCQLLDSEASLYGVQVNGLASVRWWNSKEDNDLQEDWTGLNYQLLFILLYSYLVLVLVVEVCVLQNELFRVIKLL